MKTERPSDTIQRLTSNEHVTRRALPYTVTPRKGIKYKRWKVDVNKTDLAAMLHEVLELPMGRNGLPRKGRHILNAILQTIAKGLRQDGVVKVAGLGKFYLAERSFKKRRGLFVASGFVDERLVILPPKKVVAFKPAVDVMAILNQATPNYVERRSLKFQGLL